MGLGVLDALLPERIHVAQRLYRPVRGMPALRVPVTLVDLEIEPLFVARPLEEVGHLPPLSDESTIAPCIYSTRKQFPD